MNQIKDIRKEIFGCTRLRSFAWMRWWGLENLKVDADNVGNIVFKRNFEDDRIQIGIGKNMFWPRKRRMEDLRRRLVENWCTPKARECRVELKAVLSQNASSKQSCIEVK